ncbi:MAG: 23S rRNA (uracil(1939)-C(5))-methyltransferase RlmD [Clostridia bacterium]|nr:23S rRNA (uracil(1939)-C(5))-methyltransferase RlmD [Clostridia bacterium]
MKKNDLITVTCERLGSNGEGVASFEGTTIFVPELLTGERALVKVLAVKDKIAYGKVEELFTPAEARVRPACAVFGKCGGCQLQHIRYRDQLVFKTELVKNTLKKIGGISAEVSPCIRSDKEYGYRNKLILPIGQSDGRTVVGFYAERSHRIVETKECPITEWADKIIYAVKNFAEKCGLDGYDEETGKGQLRHIAVRQLGKKFIVVLVVTEDIKGVDYFVSLLDGIFKEYSFFLNFNEQKTNVVFGKEYRLVKGVSTYTAEEAGISYEAGAETFVQVNENVRKKLYEAALSLVGEDEIVIDCYSGGGLLTAMFAKKCKRAYGIELIKEAVECADRLKAANGLSGKMFNITGRVEEELPAILHKENGATVTLDPPRAGVDRSVISALLESDIKKIVMISCNPATLARDLGLLTGTLVWDEKGNLVKAAAPNGKYEILSVQPFDMFPQTKHVETLVSLRRK